MDGRQKGSLTLLTISKMDGWMDAVHCDGRMMDGGWCWMVVVDGGGGWWMVDGRKKGSPILLNFFSDEVQVI